MSSELIYHFQKRILFGLFDFDFKLKDRRPDIKKGKAPDKYKTTLHVTCFTFSFAYAVYSSLPPCLVINQHGAIST